MGMARCWVNLVRVAPLLLGMMVSVPQIVVAPLVVAQSISQSSEQTEAQRLYEEGEQLRQQGTGESLQQALEKYQQALPLFRAGGDRNGEANSLDSIGWVFYSLMQTEQALDYYQQALPIWRELGNRKGEAITLYGIGLLYQTIGQPQQALTYYQQASAIFREVGDHSREATTLNRIGRAYEGFGQTQQALDYLQQALQVLREAGGSTEERLRQRSQEADTLINIAIVYYTIGRQPQQELDYYQQALVIRRELGDRAGQADVLGRIGMFYGRIGQPQQELEAQQQALAVSREVGGSTEERLRQRSEELIALIGIGAAYSRVGQPQQALNFYQQALPISREVGDRVWELVILLETGGLYIQVDQPQQALNYLQQALLTSRENNGIMEVPALQEIGGAYMYMEQPQQALDYYQQALLITRRASGRYYDDNEIRLLLSIGRAYSKMNQSQQAIDFPQQALSIARKFGDLRFEYLALKTIGDIYENIGQPQQALDYLQQALPISRELNDRIGEARILHKLARIQRTLDDQPAALQNIQAAITIVEDIRGQLIDPDARTTYFSTVQDYYKLQIDLLMELHQQNPDQGYAAQAFNVTERSKARTLLELLAESRADIRTGVDPQLLQQEQDIQSQLIALNQRRIELASARNVNREAIDTLEIQQETLQSQYRNLQSQIRQTSPKYAALKYPQPLTLEQIQQQILDNNTVILSYSLGEDRSYLWLISKTEMTSYALPAGKIIEALINQKVRPQLTKPRTNRNSLINDTSELSNILLQPVLEQTSTERSRSIGNKRIVIISDGALQYIPFGALPDPRAENNRYQPLLVNNEVVYLPSASTLHTLRNEAQNRPPASKTLAILADPVFSIDDQRVTQRSSTTANELPLAAQNVDRAARDTRGAWNRLPGTRQEANTILNLVPENNRLAYFDFQANRENALSNQLSQYRFIHWATHGFVNTENPELSGIVMSLVDRNGAGSNGYLLLEDIFNLSFNADLVVLSACETGLGEVVQGEGLIGLTRGLMYAGTPRVVTSLWAVPDSQTANLMGKFYEKMLQQNLSPGSALRAAQLEMFNSRNWVAPYYWAAFTLQGEWN
jgi:CHAT domain-containing protein